MPLFGRRAPTVEPVSEPIYRPAPLRVLRADGQRIDLTRRDTGQLLLATKQDWQKLAWSYRDLIGELRYAIRLLARSVARVRFYAAEVRPWPDDPVALDGDDHELDKQLAADAVHNFGLLPMDNNPDGFTARLVENLSVAGEGWVHWAHQEDQFWVRSTSEISASLDGQIVLNTLPTATAGSQRRIKPDEEDLLRCWVPHPEWGQFADSAMRTLLDVCEDVVLAGREQRAAARSRVAANGILLLPSTLSLVRARNEDDVEDDSVTSSRFMGDFTAAMLAPIRDDGDAQAVVPIVIRGEIEDLKEVRHVTLQRADANALIERQSSALMRLLKGLDVQPEQVEGTSGMNHWGAWILDARSIRDQVQPMAETIAACLSQAFLRPALLSLDHDPKQVARVAIGVDVSSLSENPNRGQDARDAHAALVISDEALRTALGFNDEDKPEDEEIARRIAAKQGLPPEVAAGVLELSRYMQQAQQGRQVIELPTRPAAELPSGEHPVARPGQVLPERATPAEPDTAAGPVVAAAGPVDGWIVDVDTARRLADIDAALAERITVAADAAIARVLERAGARIRTAARNDRTLAASLAGLDVHLIPGRLGRQQVESFVPVTDLLADSYARLRTQVTQWLADAGRQVAAVMLDLLRINHNSDRGRRIEQAVTTRLAGNTDRAWSQLAQSLDVAAERALFAPDPFAPQRDSPGEGVDTLIHPTEVREALAAAGGGGGLGTGNTVAELMGEQGAVLLGWEWQYRPERVRKPFPPHVALDGRRFSTWTDPKLDTDTKTAWLGRYFRPGDHRGCRCYAAPIWSYPELDDGIVAQRLREAAGNPRNILAGEIATQDTAAGRVGTSLQNEVEVRTRITTAVERLQREYIDQGGRSA